jgi:hypothetical protein
MGFNSGFKGLNSIALVTSSNGTYKSLSSEDDSFDKCEFCIFIEISACSNHVCMCTCPCPR